MKLSVTVVLLSLIAWGCEKDSPQPVIKKKKKAAQADEEDDDGPTYTDHRPNGGKGRGKNNGRVPLTQNQNKPAGGVPATKNPTPRPEPNAPSNISSVWDGKGFFSDANVDVKSLVK